MFGTLGTQEMVIIFLLALLLFGPKELPKIGRTIGKAVSDFRRASNELKDTFDREMKNLEAETGVKEVVNQYQYDSYNYDYSSYEGADGAYGGSYDSQTYDSASSNTPTESEPATQGAESPVAVAPEGTIAQNSVEQGPHGAGEHHPEASTTAEHKA
ncbi:MAG TPA: twin-arginine translocase TatA/TatE family subunit [Bryobacteraceae bacterium]|nr:twin-arginine translocase TatA/TatE family subunit [Bryobacteraceae bacterium]